ncbi:MAG: glycosyltransferase family 2 protein [Ferruginibacter sp.]|nr:glycosyltransferase family 2 protein [Ferruginibacter sp.]NOU38845.1 glycosyltransferase family 2 protein [Ferruginibacter sp.]
MKKNKGISVVIPNYNGKNLLPNILPPLYKALNNTQLLYEVIISDDCSTDGSIQFLKDNFEDIIILRAETNKGFSPTINKGIFATQYDLILLLNSDVKLTENYFENLLPYFECEDTFGVMGRIIGWENDSIQDGGKYPSFHGAKIKTSGNFKPVESNISDRLYSFYLSGANAMVCAKKIKKLGGFNEMFAPFYIEDVELSIRAWRIGYKCYYEHNAICRHKTSTTIKSNSSKKNINTIYYRNKMYLHALHLDGEKKWLWYLQLIAETILHIITGKLWYFTSLKMFFKSVKEIKNCKSSFSYLAAKKKLEPTNMVIKTIIKNLKNKGVIKL